MSGVAELAISLFPCHVYGSRPSIELTCEEDLHRFANERSKMCHDEHPILFQLLKGYNCTDTCDKVRATLAVYANGSCKITTLSWVSCDDVPYNWY